MTDRPTVLPLDDPAAVLDVVGGKGASLARLSQAGLPVPGGFHITTHAYREFAAALRDKILAAVAECPPAEAARRIAAIFAEHSMPEGIAASIRSAYRELGEDIPVAVRSSATAEDLRGMSFAGQQDTFLNIRGDGLLDAVKRCWASLWTERAISYRSRNGVPHDEVALAVVVQRLIPADAAGVMFTADPMNAEHLVINAAWGLGESIVGGRVTPDTVEIERASRTIIEERTGDKAVMTVRTPYGTREEKVPEERRRAAVLTGAQAVRLARLGLEIEDLYGCAMDIEWAACDGEFFVVQARPVTGMREEWNDSKSAESLWTSGNLGEAIPDVMTPATWSLVQIFIAEAMPEPHFPGYKGVGNIGGRFYMNLTIPVSITLSLGATRRLAALKQVFGMLPPIERIPRLTISRWRLLKIVVPFGFRLVRQLRADIKRLPEFKRTAARRGEEIRFRVESAATAEELADLWEKEVWPYFGESNRMLLAAGRQGGTALVMTREKLHEMVGETDAEAMLTGVNADGELASMGLLAGLGKLARGEIDRETFGRTYGHRGPHEFEVSTPRPGEDPEWIDGQLASVSEGEADELLARQEEAREAAWSRFRARYPRKEAKMRERVRAWNAIVRDRETTRSEVIRCFWALRAFILRAGALTGHGDDLFFLSISEILDVLRGSTAPLAKVPIRRSTYELYASLPVYPAMIIGEFDPVRWAASPSRRGDLYDGRPVDSPVSTESAGEQVRGFPGAPGIVEGTARLIAAPEDGDRLGNGEILVTTATNVGWTPMFPRAAAVVTDIGAPLSHASIVARELGIPAVVGTGDATARLSDGDRIRVDGERGTVEVLAPPHDVVSTARSEGGENPSRSWMAGQQNGRVRIISVDPDDEGVFRIWYDTQIKAFAAGRDDPPLWTYEEYKVNLRSTGFAEHEAYLALDGDTPVGAGMLEMPLRENTGLLMFEFAVLPERRRRGAGNALFVHVEGVAKIKGRTSLLTEVALPMAEPETGPAVSFLTERGFTKRLTDVRRGLRLPMDEDVLDKLTPRTGYEIVTWSGACPDEYAEQYARLKGLLINEVPLGDLNFEQERWDVRRLREEEEKIAAQGRTVYTTIALAGDGTVAGHTQIGVPRDGDRAFQWDTLVLKEHRGHRLGLALKVANLRALQKGSPTADRITTWNAEQNGPMIAVNEQLGFEPVELSQEWQRDPQAG